MQPSWRGGHEGRDTASQMGSLPAVDLALWCTVAWLRGYRGKGSRLCVPTVHHCLTGCTVWEGDLGSLAGAAAYHGARAAVRTEPRPLSPCTPLARQVPQPVQGHCDGKESGLCVPIAATTLKHVIAWPGGFGRGSMSIRKGFNVAATPTTAGGC